MKKRLSSIFLTLCMLLALLTGVTAPASADPDQSSDVNLFQMYVGGYMNMLVHAEAYPTSKIEADALKNTEIEFKPGTGYSLVSVSAFTNKSSGYAASHNTADFYNQIKGDKNGNIIVFGSTSPLYGLIVRADTGFMFISGFPKKAVENDKLGTPQINAEICHEKTDPDSVESYQFTFKFYDAGYDIEAWPTDAGTDVPYVMSHGYATVLDSDADSKYALAVESSSPSLGNGTLSTWYPGNSGKTVASKPQPLSSSQEAPAGAPTGQAWVWPSAPSSA